MLSVPEGITDPLAVGLNASVMSVTWSKPVHPNGPSPLYVLYRYGPAFNQPPQVVETGHHFTGLNYQLFPPETIPQGVTYTGMFTAGIHLL